eukprot:5741924-Prorocentrum_lima.AAC.1
MKATYVGSRKAAASVLSYYRRRRSIHMYEPTACTIWWSWIRYLKRFVQLPLVCCYEVMHGTIFCTVLRCDALWRPLRCDGGH